MCMGECTLCSFTSGSKMCRVFFAFQRTICEKSSINQRRDRKQWKIDLPLSFMICQVANCWCVNNERYSSVHTHMHTISGTMCLFVCMLSPFKVIFYKNGRRRQLFIHQTWFTTLLHLPFFFILFCFSWCLSH